MSFIHESAKIHHSVKIGSFVCISENVIIGENCVVEPHAVIHKNTIIGQDNYIAPFVSLGGASQSKHDLHSDESFLVIGNGNSFHEYCSINRGSKDKQTLIGNNNVFMAYTHVAHDCVIEDSVVMVNQATLAGHVRVASHTVLGYAVAVRQFCSIGYCAFIDKNTAIVKDVLPYVIVRGNPSRVVGINKVGLERIGLAEVDIASLKDCFRTVFKRNFTTCEAISELEQMNFNQALTARMIEMLSNSTRGLVR